MPNEKKPARRQPLNLREWWDHVGTDNVEKVAEAAGTSMGYVKLMRYGNRKPSGALAMKIVEHAKAITPGFVPDLELLIRGVEYSPQGTKIPPSPEFLRSLKSRQRRENRTTQ